MTAICEDITATGRTIVLRDAVELGLGPRPACRSRIDVIRVLRVAIPAHLDLTDVHVRALHVDHVIRDPRAVLLGSKVDLNFHGLRDSNVTSDQIPVVVLLARPREAEEIHPHRYRNHLFLISSPTS